MRLIGIGLIGIVILTIVIQRLFMKKIETLSNEVRKLSGTTAAVETESLTKSEDIFMSGFQNNFLEKAYSCNSDLFQKIVKRNMFHALSSTATTILQTFSLIMILCVGGILINAKYISVDIGISMYIYIQKLSSPINQLINQIMNMMEIRPSIDKIIALIDNKDDIMWGKGGINGMIESIEYKNISFQYPNQQKKLFENFNCIINRNEMVQEKARC